MKAAWILLPALLLGAGSAQAAIATWVSGTGSDAGNCQITAPCRTFAFAHDQTNNNGAINVLSSGNFGPLTITKPISIVSDGVEAIINTGADGAGIKIQADANAVVSLRGLTIDLRGTDNQGVSFVSAAALHVQNCVIRRSANGIRFNPQSGTSELYVADSVLANSTGFGIFVIPTGSAGARITVDRVRVENGSGIGLELVGTATTGSISATVRDSVAAGNAAGGIRVLNNGGGATDVMVDRSAFVNSGNTGIFVNGAGARIRIGNSTVSGNLIGLFVASNAVLNSYGNNKVNGNATTDVSGTVTQIETK